MDTITAARSSVIDADPNTSDVSAVGPEAVTSPAIDANGDFRSGDRTRSARLAAKVSQSALGRTIGATVRQAHKDEEGEEGEDGEDRASAGTLRKIADTRSSTRALASKETFPMSVDELSRSGATAVSTDPGLPVPLAARVRERARPCVMARLADPTLTPSTLARDMGISRSSLYHALAHPTGVGRFIRDVRLDAARAALEAASPCKGVVTYIHKAHGFPQYLVFYRAFRDRFGISPSEAVGTRTTHDQGLIGN